MNGFVRKLIVRVVPVMLALLCAGGIVAQEEGPEVAATEKRGADRTEEDWERIRSDLRALQDRYKKQLPESFQFRHAAVYLVVSNLDEDTVNDIITGTIMAANKTFYRSFMDERPRHAVTIFLFRDDSSYRKWAKELFGDEGVSKFGYYKSGENALLMNINTGTGTLVHEMVHLFMEYDFRDAPPWFSEGLGSLYEQCRLSRHGPVGLVNWRLPVLKEAIENDRLVDLKELMKQSRSEFYGTNVGVHYAEARYLLMYLQEREKLADYYRAFRDAHDDDPHGINTLKSVMDRDLTALQEEWLE